MRDSPEQGWMAAIVVKAGPRVALAGGARRV